MGLFTDRLDAIEGEVLSAKQIAGALEVSPQTVSRWAREGILPAGVKMGRRRTWEKKVLREAIAEYEGVW